MGLWLWDADPQFSFSLADELTAVTAALIARGALDDAGPLPPSCDVVDLSARRSLVRLRAVRLARAAEGGPDA